MTNMHRQSSSLQKRRKRCRRRFLQSAAQPEQELQSKDAAVDVPPSLPLEVRAGQASSSAGNVEMDDLGLAVPVTPPREYVMVESPRSAPATRPTETEGDEVLKKQRVEDAKKQRINQMRMDYEKRLSAVKIEYKEYFTMDEYETELDVDKEMEDEDEIWAGEESVELHGIPEGVWSDSPIDQTPLPPESWVDELADKVEIQLCAVQVLIPAKQFQGEVTVVQHFLGTLQLPMAVYMLDYYLPMLSPNEGYNETELTMPKCRTYPSNMATNCFRIPLRGQRIWTLESQRRTRCICVPTSKPWQN